MQKTTVCGRFTVSITSNVAESSMLLTQDSARSLKELADVLTEGSACAMRAAIAILEGYKLSQEGALHEGGK